MMNRKQKKRAVQQAKKTDFNVLGTNFTGADSSNGMSTLNFLPNPDPILKAQGGRIQVYRDLKDAHLGSVRRKRRMGISSKSWSLQSGNGNADKASIVETQLWNIGLRNAMRTMMEAIDFGYQVTEVIWENVDGVWLPAALKDIPQETFKFSKSGEFIFASEKNGNIPPYKFLLTRNDPSSQNPYGEAVMSECFWPIKFKKGGLNFWLMFVEKFAMPKVVGKTPVSASDAEREDFLKKLYGLIRDAALVVNDNTTVETLEPKVGGVYPYESIVTWADREMSKAYLGETLTTEQTDTGGTRALGEVHNEVRLEMTQDDIAMIESTMNTLLKWVWELNWPDDEEIPWFQFAQPKDMQTGELDRDKKLYDLGVRFTDKHFIDLYGVSPDHITEIVSPQSGGMFAEGDEKPNVRIRSSHKKADKAVKEIMSEVSADDLQKQVEEMARPIINLCESCGSYEEFEKALLNIAPDIKSDKLEEAVTKCMMISEAKGIIDG